MSEDRKYAKGQSVTYIGEGPLNGKKMTVHGITRNKRYQIHDGRHSYTVKEDDLKEAKDQREYGYEGDMAMSQLKGIMNHAKQLHDMLKPDTDLPEWVQSKITLAYDYIQTATDYMNTEMNEEIGIGAPTNSVGDGAGVQGIRPDTIGVKRKSQSKYAAKNAAEAPSPIMGGMQARKTLTQFKQGR